MPSLIQIFSIFFSLVIGTGQSFQLHKVKNNLARQSIHPHWETLAPLAIRSGEEKLKLRPHMLSDIFHCDAVEGLNVNGHSPDSLSTNSGYVHAQFYSGPSCSGISTSSIGYATNICYSGYNSAGVVTGSVFFQCQGETAIYIKYPTI